MRRRVSGWLAGLQQSGRGGRASPDDRRASKSSAPEASFSLALFAGSVAAVDYAPKAVLPVQVILGAVPHGSRENCPRPGAGAAWCLVPCDQRPVTVRCAAVLPCGRGFSNMGCRGPRARCPVACGFPNKKTVSTFRGASAFWVAPSPWPGRALFPHRNQPQRRTPDGTLHNHRADYRQG